MPFLAGDYTFQDYQEIESNQEVKVVQFQMEKDSSEWYVRLCVDLTDDDTLLTFGPMSKADARLLRTLMQKHYCHVWFETEGPFEFERGNPDYAEEEEE